MTSLRGIYLKLRAVLLRRRVEREMQEELSFHLEREIEKNVSAGFSPGAARRRALISFGGVDASREAMRDGRGGRWLADLAIDIRYALRWLGRSPGFTVVAVLTLALGIGATTAIFAVLHAVWLDPLPYPQSDDLAIIYSQNRERNIRGSNISYPDYRSWKEQVRSFDGLGIFQWNSRTISGGGQAERVAGAEVSADLFSVLGVAPMLGRGVATEEERQGQRVVVIGSGLWQRRFGGDSAVIGRTLTIDDEAYTIIGVMPPRFQFPYTGQVWTPLVHEPQFEARGNRYLAGAVGRLAPGVTRAEAEAELARVSAQLSQAYPESNREWGGQYLSIREELFGSLRQGVVILFIAAGLVLLIVCGNLANLLLARGTVRERELALRTALGAARGRLIRQLLSESAVLALLGSAIAVVVAVWGVRVLRASAVGQLPAFIDIAVSPSMFLFEFAIATLVLLLTGLLPALRGARRDAETALRAGVRSTGTTRTSRLRAALIVSEVGLCVVLLVGSLLLIKTMSALNEIDLGFDPHNLLTARYDLSAGKYAEAQQRQVFLDAIQSRLRPQAGVLAVGAAQGTPFSGWNVGGSYEVLGEAAAAPGQKPSAHLQVVSPEFFSTLGVPIIKGRGIEPSDADRGSSVAVVNQAFVARHFADQDPLGKQLRLHGEEEWTTIVGVVGDFRHFQIIQPARPAIYFHYAWYAPRQMTLAIRTRGPASDLIAVLRRSLAELDPDVPAFAVNTMDGVIGQLTWVRRVTRDILAAFAATAVLLAVIGLYGVIAYSVAQQRHEFGIRLALGAAPRRLLQRVVRGGLKLAVAGIVLGWTVGFIAARGLASLLFEVQPADASTFVIVPLVVAALAVLAAMGPALRAASTDPMLVLRSE